MALKTTEYSIFADIPQALAFSFVSDLHDCPNKPVLDLIRRQTPDAILVGGDFVHNTKQYGRGLEFLRDAAKIAPTFVSIGNHERHLGRSV